MNPKLDFFLDMDGVLCDFAGGLARRYRKKMSDLPTGVYDMSKLLGTTFEEIDDQIKGDYMFWRELKPYPRASQVLHLFQSVGQVKILSSPWPDSICCYTAKLDWCQEELGFNPSDVILTPHKYLLAGPNRVLIDDRHDLCEQWVSWGGLGAIVCPAHHNSDQVQLIGKDSYDHLSYYLHLLLDQTNYNPPAHDNSKN